LVQIREKQWLKVFDNRGLEDVKRRLKWEEVAVGWRKLHKEELQVLHSLPYTVGLINQGG
jgi:hypothetical protein